MSGVSLELVRVDKRIPDGSIWQSRNGYRLPDHEGWVRVFDQAGTRWSNRLGGWKQEHPGVTVVHPDRAFVVSCHGPEGAKRFYIDVARLPTISTAVIDFVDLFLDVMIDPSGHVTEKDEDQLLALTLEEAALARRVRDEVRRLIASENPLFDPRGPYYAIPTAVAELPPAPPVD